MSELQAFAPELEAPGEVAQDGARDAAQELTSHIRLVMRWVARLGGPNVEVADVTQEVFLVAHRKLPTFRGECKLTTWLYAITVRVLKARRRKEWLRRWVGGSADDVAGELPSLDESPAEEAERREDRQRVWKLLERLPEKQRQAVILSEYEEMSNAEIAALMGVAPPTISTWIFRAKARLLELLKEERGTAEEVHP